MVSHRRAFDCQDCISHEATRKARCQRQCSSEFFFYFLFFFPVIGARPHGGRSHVRSREGGGERHVRPRRLQRAPISRRQWRAPLTFYRTYTACPLIPTMTFNNLYVHLLCVCSCCLHSYTLVNFWKVVEIDWLDCSFF